MKASILRREQDILERLENVKRLIEMETTLMTAEGAKELCGCCRVDREGKRLGSSSQDVLHDIRDNIQMQLLSITALCYGDNPDIGEPMPMLEWNHTGGEHPSDKFHRMWEECLTWNA